MLMKKFFEELLGYNNYCNQLWTDLFENHPYNITEKSIKIFSHIINAHHIWNHRIESQQSLLGVWQIHDIHSIKKLCQDNHKHSLRLLSIRGVDEVVSYTNSMGQSFNNTVRDILFHIINHSTYHRAQMASEFKMQGKTPPVTDYIIYKRK